jgi:hypothetical protein
MALKTNQTIEHDGKNYPLMCVNLALSPMWKPDGVGLSVAVRLTPYRMGEDGPEVHEKAVQAVVFGDATEAARQDPAVAEFLRAIESAGQAFIDAKGL